MAFFVVVARHFGPTGLGELTLLLMVGSVVGLVIGDLGVNTTMIARMSPIRGISRESFAGSALFCKVSLTVISLACMIISMRILLPAAAWLEILSVSAISCGSIIWLEFFAALTNGVNRLELEAWFRLLYRGLVYGGGAVVCFFASLTNVLAFMAVAAIISLVPGFLVLRASFSPIRMLSHRGMTRSLLQHSIPVWITQVAQISYLKLDVLILGALHLAAQQIGWYAAAWKIVDLLTTIPALLATAALPLISGALPETNVKTIAPGYLRAMYIFPYFVVLPLAIGADWVSQVLYGSAYVGSGEILRILVWVLIPISVHSFLAVVSVATRRQVEAARIGAVSALLGLIAALLAVPRLGYPAMAVISLAVNSLFAIVLVYRFRDVTSSAHLSLVAKSSASALIVYGLSRYLASSCSELPLLLCGTAGYGVALMLLGVVTMKDFGRGWQFIGSMFWNRSSDEAGLA